MTAALLLRLSYMFELVLTLDGAADKTRSYRRRLVASVAELIPFWSKEMNRFTHIRFGQRAVATAVALFVLPAASVIRTHLGAIGPTLPSVMSHGVSKPQASVRKR